MGFLRRPQNLKKSSSYFWQERRVLCAQQRTCQKVDDVDKLSGGFSLISNTYLFYTNDEMILQLLSYGEKEVDLFIYILGSWSIWMCRILNFKFWIFVIFFFRQLQLKKSKQILYVRHHCPLRILLEKLVWPYKSGFNKLQVIMVLVRYSKFDTSKSMSYQGHYSFYGRVIYLFII